MNWRDGKEREEWKKARIKGGREEKMEREKTRSREADGEKEREGKILKRKEREKKEE